MDLALGYWRSQVLFVAQELGVFSLLQGGALSAAEVAQRCGTAPGHTERLLNACVSLGLVDKRGSRFSNSRLAAELLVAGAPRPMSRWVRFMAACYQPWGHLAEAIRTGRPVVQEGHEQIASGQAFTRDLILAMHDYALGPGRGMAAALDLAGRRRLLDVGGGPGTYAMLLAERFPDLQAVVLDLPPVLEITRELIAQAGLDGRVTTRPGSYLTDDFGQGYDVVLLSNMLHQEDRETGLALLRKAHAALPPGGLLVVQASYLNADQTGPPWAVLQGVQLLLFYEGGRTYSAEETVELVREAGFANPAMRKPSLLSSESLILATRPATE